MEEQNQQNLMSGMIMYMLSLDGENTSVMRVPKSYRP